jgi:type VI protein secretion system component VasF
VTPKTKKRKGGIQARRFFEMLNTPIAVLAVLAVVVAVNTFLFFGYYLPRLEGTAPPISSPAPMSATATPTATSSP